MLCAFAIRKLVHAINRFFENFQLKKKNDIFLILAQDIDYGYTSTHNLCFGAKIRKIVIPMHTPVLLYIKCCSMGYTLHVFVMIAHMQIAVFLMKWLIFHNVLVQYKDKLWFCNNSFNFRLLTVKITYLTTQDKTA